MSTIKRIALASAVSASLLSSASFAAAPGQMQGAANAQAQAITKAVNVSKATIQCKQATLRIASAAKAKAGKLKGAELRSAIMEATTAAATKFGIANGCVTPVNVASAASRLTGMYPATGPTMGLAKAGGAGAMAGAASGAAGAVASAAGGISKVKILAGVAGVIGIAAILANDDDPDAPAPTTLGNSDTNPDIVPLGSGGSLSNVTQTAPDANGSFQQVGQVSGGATGAGTSTTTFTPTAAGGNTYQVTQVVRDADGTILFTRTYTQTYAVVGGAPDLSQPIGDPVNVSTPVTPTSAST